MYDSDPQWSEADPSVINTAKMLIKAYHLHLLDARICFVFRKEAQKTNGKDVLAQASKVTAKMQPFFEYDFLIWVSKEDWERSDSAFREALIDHELCHCKLGENGWKLIRHDVEEFHEIIARHGFWNRSLKKGAAVMKNAAQISLPDFDMQVEHQGKVTTIAAEAMRKALELSELGAQMTVD